MKVTMINTIITTRVIASVSKNDIQIGDTTQIQGQLITCVSLSAISKIVNKPVNPIPPLAEDATTVVDRLRLNRLSTSEFLLIATPILQNNVLDFLGRQDFHCC